MHFFFDTENNRFVLDANDFDASGGVLAAVRQYLEEFRAKPNCHLLVYRDNPSTSTLDWGLISGIPKLESDEFIATLKTRKIAGVLGNRERFAVGRQVAVMTESLDIRYKPFLTEQEAIAWLNET